MTDGTHDDEDEPQDPRFVALAAILDELIEKLCERHYDAKTQEHQLTSRIAEAIEEAYQEISIDGIQISIRVQELPDRGSGSLERPTGADLYISIVRIDEPGRAVSKGILVQSKWDDALSPLRTLRQQSEDMLRRSDEFYVWIYGPHGASVIPATEFREPNPDLDSDMTAGDLIGKAIECTAGDEEIGRNLDLPLVESLNRQLEELAAPTALSFVVTRV